MGKEKRYSEKFEHWKEKHFDEKTGSLEDKFAEWKKKKPEDEPKKEEKLESKEVSAEPKKDKKKTSFFKKIKETLEKKKKEKKTEKPQTKEVSAEPKKEAVSAEKRIEEKFKEEKKEVDELLAAEKAKKEAEKKQAKAKQSIIAKILLKWPLKEKGKLKEAAKILKKADIKDKKKEKKKKKEEKKRFESNLEIIRRKQQKKRKIKISRYEKLKHIKSYLEKAGYEVSDEPAVSKRINIISIAITFFINIYMVYIGVITQTSLFFLFTQLFVSWIVLFPAAILLHWSIFYFYLDFRIFNRKKQLEEVLPDFLQLTSANINAGMPLDQALWYAVRPRFGILAKEIEDVAKLTIVGEELKDALVNFYKRYDSLMLKRTVNLMIEGLDAGGEIGSLLNKIAIDIQETRIIRKDMAANVTTYVIFISFATIVAAPFLFALSNQLLTIIQSLVANINIPENVPTGGLMSFSFSEASISIKDFKIFAMSALAMTAFFSASIISVIQKGNIKEGVKYIPTFIFIALFIFLVATRLLGYFLGGLI